MKLIHGDNMEVMKGFPDCTFPVVITDPPYGLSAVSKTGKRSAGGFMGMKWDYDIPSVETFKEILRVTKPGGVMFSFAGPRTQHRMGVNIEDAGWFIVDQIHWLFGSGMGLAHDISKAIDKEAGAEREVVGKRKYKAGSQLGKINDDSWAPKDVYATKPATKAAEEWEGYKSPLLKKGFEPIICAIRPREGTYAQNVLKHGCGALNFEGVRIGTDEIKSTCSPNHSGRSRGEFRRIEPSYHQGRYPSHLLIDSEVAARIDLQSGVCKSGAIKPHHKTQASENRAMSGGNYERGVQNIPASQGGASRYFQRIDYGEEDRFCYTAKAGKKEVNFGVDKCDHPTIKPIKLMRWLVRLSKLPKNTVVFDPFMGMASTGWACLEEGVDFVGIEREKEYFAAAEKRIAAVKEKIELESKQLKLFEDPEPVRKEPVPKQGKLFG